MYQWACMGHIITLTTKLVYLNINSVIFARFTELGSNGPSLLD